MALASLFSSDRVFNTLINSLNSASSLFDEVAACAGCCPERRIDPIANVVDVKQLSIASRRDSDNAVDDEEEVVVNSGTGTDGVKADAVVAINDAMSVVTEDFLILLLMTILWRRMEVESGGLAAQQLGSGSK